MVLFGKTIIRIEQFEYFFRQGVRIVAALSGIHSVSTERYLQRYENVRSFYRKQDELKDAGSLVFWALVVYCFCCLDESFPAADDMLSFVVVKEGEGVWFDVLVFSH